MRRHSPTATLAVALALMAIVSSGCVLRNPVAPTPSSSTCSGSLRASPPAPILNGSSMPIRPNSYVDSVSGVPPRVQRGSPDRRPVLR